MAEQDLVRIAREQIEAFNAGDFDRIDTMMVADAVYSEPATNRRLEGRAAIREAFQGWRTAFPDVTGTVINAIASGDHVVLELRWEGTHTGPLEGPAGRSRPRTSLSCCSPHS